MHHFSSQNELFFRYPEGIGHFSFGALDAPIPSRKLVPLVPDRFQPDGRRTTQETAAPFSSAVILASTSFLVSAAPIQ